MRSLMGAAMYAAARLWVAAAILAAGCAPARYDARDFPKASSSSGGVTVTWSGRLDDIRVASARMRPGEAQMEGQKRQLSLRFAVWQSGPVIPPFIPGRRVVIVTSDAAGLLGTNRFKVGDKFEMVLIVWRTPDGRLKAERAGGD